MTPTLYQNVVCKATLAYRLFTDSLASLTDMENTLSLTNAADARKAILREEIESCRNALVEQSINCITRIQEVVIAMNNNILRDNSDVNAYLIDNGIRIPQFVADAMLKSGFTFATKVVGDVNLLDYVDLTADDFALFVPIDLGTFVTSNEQSGGADICLSF